MKITDLKDNEVIHITNKKEAEAINKILSKKGLLNIYFEKGYLRTEGKDVYFYLRTTSFNIDNIIILPASKFIKSSLKKRVKALEIKIKVLEKGSNFIHELNNIEVNSELVANCNDVPVNGNKLLTGEWYKNNSNCLFNYSGKTDEDNDPFGYGFDDGGIWNGLSEYDGEGWGQKGLQKATPEEVSAALINEAKKRGYKSGIKLSPLDFFADIIEQGKENYIYDTNCGVINHRLTLNGTGIYQDGKWAEIVKTEKEPETIDWSKPALFISDKGYIVQSTGVNQLETFEGITVNDSEIYSIWSFSRYWSKSQFKIYTGEPITLKNY